MGRIFVQEISRWHRGQALASPSRSDTPDRSASIRSGAICFPQRFGGSLNLNVHYHVAMPDGVFVQAQDSAGTITFQQLPVPNRSDLEAIGHGVELRVLRWLRRRGLLAADETEQPSRDNSEADALDACCTAHSESESFRRYRVRAPRHETPMASSGH